MVSRKTIDVHKQSDRCLIFMFLGVKNADSNKSVPTKTRVFNFHKLLRFGNVSLAIKHQTDFRPERVLKKLSFLRLNILFHRCCSIDAVLKK